MTNAKGAQTDGKSSTPPTLVGRPQVSVTADCGSVRQSFSHGRSLLVPVEVPKRRTAMLSPSVLSGPSVSEAKSDSAEGGTDWKGQQAPRIGASKPAHDLAARYHALRERQRNIVRRRAERRELEPFPIFSSSEAQRRRGAGVILAQQESEEQMDDGHELADEQASSDTDDHHDPLAGVGNLQTACPEQPSIGIPPTGEADPTSITVNALDGADNPLEEKALKLAEDQAKQAARRRRDIEDWAQREERAREMAEQRAQAEKEACRIAEEQAQKALEARETAEMNVLRAGLKRQEAEEQLRREEEALRDIAARTQRIIQDRRHAEEITRKELLVRRALDRRAKHEQEGGIGETKLFLSYRRSDSQMIAGRIFDRLAAHFGAKNVIFDIDSIPLGVDFRIYIQEVLVECHAVLVVVGSDWVGSLPNEQTRIQMQTDPVRLEVEIAMRAGIPVIPVLVGHAEMPDPDLLPPDLRDFSFLNAATVDIGRDFHVHIDRLIKNLPTGRRVGDLSETAIREGLPALFKAAPSSSVTSDPELIG